MTAEVLFGHVEPLSGRPVRWAPAQVAAVMTVQMPLAEERGPVSRLAQGLGNGHLVKWQVEGEGGAHAGGRQPADNRVPAS